MYSDLFCVSSIILVAQEKFSCAIKMATTTAFMVTPQTPPKNYIESKQVKESKALLVSKLGWLLGSGGSMSKSFQHFDMPLSGVEKERRMVGGYTYLLSSNASVVSAPKCTDSAPHFNKAECYHYLFEPAIKRLDSSSPSHGPVRAEALNGGHEHAPSRHCILLDIEGTTTPISFVTDVLFPYARDNVRKHLIATYNTEETKDDIKLLRSQVEDDLKQGVVGAKSIPPDVAGKEEVISSVVANVEAMILADRKITALKQLQGHIWRTGFQGDELKGVVFEDVPEALKKWHASGIKVYIYSSGSREAQRLIFGNSNYGDLRRYLCGFFDTSIGNKKETRSYFEISQSVGVDSPSEVLFLTDVYQEAMVAQAAGLEVIISIRPGNEPLPENHGFRTIESFVEI
ncbi:hypothetical protein IFM89_005833 [Coptis chinensis]|uniref:Enolase-phosphatase E1 n=1 Tax=Coptis chinensis TaxID=261450 RepID=A0A835LDI9_9MAGN|nr:hypothetical protein IFM89_005833 [Coptis chinensis]